MDLTKDLVINNETLQLGYFSRKFQNWVQKLWGTSSKYSVLLTQAATSAPVVTILEDSIKNITVARTDVGTYTFTKTGAFVVGKSATAKAEQYIDADGNKFVLTPTSVDVYTLTTYAAVDDTVLADGVLTDQYLNIEIYS